MIKWFFLKNYLKSLLLNPSIVEMTGAILKIIHTTQECAWKITANDILKHASKKTKMIILNNAANPAVMLYSKDEIEAILEAASQLKITVLSYIVGAYVKNEMQKRMNLFIDEYSKIFESIVIPDAGLYYFAKVAKCYIDFCERSLEKAHVALVPDITFGVDAITEMPETIVKGLHRLKEYYNEI